MAALKLYVGNKNYSSWSMRPWLAMKAAGIDFTDEVIPFDFPAGNPAIKAISESGTVPVLEHDGLKIGETLAIIEYVAELQPDKRLWPADRKDRALARAYCSEMATGFRALRNAAPMNLRYPRKKLDVGEDVKADIKRIEEIWHKSLSRSGGPFLFGEFTAVDAFFAPVVARFDSYILSEHPVTLAYIKAVKSHPAWIAWATDAAKETWIVPEDEI
ncbi:glutathione S-transferase family protein [Rhizobium sp. LjRoot254]|uniref:glutathione S-transferase family protein n=1 Tax=Rhizobium sp. LjRoot254 TaxID=3342297 RepID=UPI003ECCD6CF